MRIENLNLVPNAMIPCVMNIIAEYYPEDETVTIDTSEAASPFLEVIINDTSYIIGSTYDIDSYVTESTEDSFQDWCYTNRVTDEVLKYIDKDQWMSDNREDFESLFECEYLTTFEKYEVYERV